MGQAQRSGKTDRVPKCSRNARRDADKQEALVEWAKTKHGYIACLQEVWRTGTKVQDNVHVHSMPTGWALITHGLQTAVCARGSQGVGILLSPEAKVAWEKAGCDTFTFGDRILAVRLLLRDEKGRTAYTLSLIHI